jgi:PilZ domain
VTQQERRREQRFPLRHRASVKVDIGSSEISGVTENVSGHGVLLYADSFIPLGTGVEIVLVPKLEAAKKIKLIYAGKVLRSELLATGRFAVAAACERCVAVRAEETHLEQAPIKDPQ